MEWRMQTLIFKCPWNYILNFNLKDPLILKTKQRHHSVSTWYLIPLLQESFRYIIWYRWHNETEEGREIDCEGRVGTLKVILSKCMCKQGHWEQAAQQCARELVINHPHWENVSWCSDRKKTFNESRSNIFSLVPSGSRVILLWQI